VKTVAEAFSDHFAVIVHTALDGTHMMTRASVWRMSITLLEVIFPGIIKEKRGKWQRNIRYYPNKVIWWDTYVKRNIEQTFQRESAERNCD
jgi:hemerythrin superfamily protein